MNISSAVLDLAKKHLGDFRIKNEQIVAKRCPFCHGGDNNDYETFAVGLNNGLWNCMRGSCKKKKGNFRELSEFFGEVYSELEEASRFDISRTKHKKKYDKPNQDDIHELTDEIISYFSRRMISEETLRDFKIGSDDKGNIVFPFYRDGVLTYVKYRPNHKIEKGDSTPKEWAMANTEPILFGMDNVSFNLPVVITEGMIDALSIYEAGFKNVLSVPSGCKNFDWIEGCYDWLMQFNQIILFGDADEPGQEMVTILQKRLGEDRCMLPPAYPELVYNGKDYNQTCKDANEILVCYGPDYLKDMIDACKRAPVKNVLNFASIPLVDPTTIPRILTNIPRLDNAIGGFGEGGVTVVSGNSGEGKSTITGTFLLSAVEQGYNVCAYSGELTASNFAEWICHQAVESKYVGYKVDPRSRKTYTFLSEEVISRVKRWLDGRIYLYDNSVITEENQADSVIRAFEVCAKRYGCKLFLADNLMCLTVSPEEENRAQAKVSAQMKAFASKYKAHVILVAHPRKRKPGETFTNMDISGSSAIGNLADTILNIERPNIRVTKNRNFGIKDFIVCDYNPANRRIYQSDMKEEIVYSWDHKGVPLPENPAMTLPEFDIQHGAGGEQPV